MASTVAKVLVEQLLRFGIMVRKFAKQLLNQLLSSQGPEFGSELFLELYKRVETDNIRKSPYRPACNGMLEHYRQTLNSVLAKVVEETGMQKFRLSWWVIELQCTMRRDTRQTF